MTSIDITQGHTVTSFSDDLAHLRELVLSIGSLVLEQVTHGVAALVNGDITTCKQIVEDRRVYDLDIKANEEILRVLALRHPVAIDLRLVIALSKCVHELTSARSKAKRIAAFAIQLHTDATREPRKKFLVQVQHMSTCANYMLKASLEALQTTDPQKATSVIADDDKLDLSFDTGVRHLTTFMLENPASITGALDMIFVLKSLERIGDHACHIAEQVIFIRPFS